MLFVLTATAANAQCTASFSYTASGNTASFTDLSTTSSGSITSWGWDFGDGNFDNTQNPSHTYAIGGQYIVTLSIFTSSFCFDTYTDTVTVNGGCTASFTYAVDTSSGTVSFQAQPLSQNLSYSWNFGDSTTGMGTTPSHTYTASGTYYVCLMIADTAGFCSDTICDSVVVNIAPPPPCSATFTWADQGDGGVFFSADDFSFDATYDWNFGDMTQGQGAFAFHEYPMPGTYYVCLTVNDSTCTATYCDSVTVVADTTNCDASFTHFEDGLDMFAWASPFSASSNATYLWDFGDGDQATGISQNHTYQSAGTYYVCVTYVNTFNGCNDTYCDSVTVIDTGVEDVFANSIRLNAYPNPVSSTMVISFTFADRMEAEIAVFDFLGSKVEIISSKELPAGNYRMEWNAEKLASGAYMLRITTSKGTAARLLIRN